jgi:hypothetical protein
MAAGYARVAALGVTSDELKSRKEKLMTAHKWWQTAVFYQIYPRHTHPRHQTCHAGISTREEVTQPEWASELMKHYW